MIYVIASIWCYPFGGGEEYLNQTAIWLYKQRYKCYWICFSNAKNKPFESLEIEKTEYCTILKIPNGFNEEKLYNWLKYLNPNIVHHQGHLRESFSNVCEKLRIEFISGLHFWNGCILLDENKKNIDILENSNYHKPDPEFNRVLNNKHTTIYSVSKFVKECVKKINNIDIPLLCYSGSNKDTCLVNNINVVNNKYITVINIHKLKGGELVLKLLQSDILKNMSFLVIATEYHSEGLDLQIKQEIEKRDNSIYLLRTNNIKEIYGKTKIFLAPSLVDETFCRTVNEAMMNGIPVLTTKQGNLKYLCSNILDPNNSEEWINKIEQLYNNDELLIEESKKMLKEYEEYSEEICQKMFLNAIDYVNKKSKEFNIMLLSPWCDQGLGIQSRNYYKILEKNNFNVFVFAIKPYNASTNLELQKNKDEWLISNIYYSKNDREKIKDYEILDFINKYNIGKCIIPETCWFRIFEITKLLKNNNVKCYAVPNIEIVRKDEVFKHTYFHKILCNNKLCENEFNKRRIFNTEYIGYGIDNIQLKSKQISNITKFLFIGGMNAFSRKHIIDICHAFSIAYQTNKNIMLTCTIQKTNLLEIDEINKLNIYLEHENITFIQDHLTYSSILNLYYEHDISIQVSKHEGLGLGFYEALSTGTPIISLDTPPHNEIILDNINGWLIPCYYKEMTDNPVSLIKSAYFNPIDLGNKMLEILDNKDIYKSLLHDYETRLKYNIFEERFINSILN